MKLQDFINNGITITNDMGEIRKTTPNSIVFKNGWVASIVKKEDKHSVAICDYNGYFNWEILIPFGNEEGVIICETEEEICNALFVIQQLKAKH